MLELRQCAVLELSKQPICCAVAAGHRLAKKERLTVQDLYGEKYHSLWDFVLLRPIRSGETIFEDA